MMQNQLAWLEDWYATQCNGEWEHSYGVKIDTLDNPGWEITIDLNDTSLAGHEMINMKVNRSENDWFNCKVVDNKFIGYGGIKNLSDMIICFKTFVESKGA